MPKFAQRQSLLWTSSRLQRVLQGSLLSTGSPTIRRPLQTEIIELVEFVELVAGAGHVPAWHPPGTCLAPAWHSPGTRPASAMLASLPAPVAAKRRMMMYVDAFPL